MNFRIGSAIYSYGVAVGSVAVATWLHFLAQSLVGDRFPYITYFPAVFVTAVLTGFYPTLLAVVLSALAAARWVIPPADSLFPVDAGGWVALGLFTFFGIGMAWLGEIMRRRADQIQRERERFLVTLASIGDGVIVTDRNARITFMNAVAEQLTGYFQAETLGRPLESVFQIINEFTRKPCENPVDRALREGRIVALANHTVLITKDGIERCIDDSAAPIREGGEILGVVLVFRDVSEQRAAQIERARLAAIVNSSEDAILGQAFDGTVTNWNVGAERLFGYTAEEALGRSMFSLIVPPEKKQELLDALEQIRQGKRLDQFESVRRHRDGHRIPVAIRISPIQNAEGEIVGASAIDRDISRQKAAERRRNARLAVTQILAHEQIADQAIQEILSAVCSALDWDVGCFWKVEPDANGLCCQAFWQQPDRNLDAFRLATMNASFGSGSSLPGRVWKSREPVWFSDVTKSPEFVRAPAAQEVGLHGGFACPVAVGDEFLGVVEWFSRQSQQPDEDLLEMMATIGGQIGQFVERRHAEEMLRRSERELSDFFENAAIGLHWVGSDGKILRVNRAELQMLGYTREEYIGRPISEFYADKDVIENILTCLRSGEDIHDQEVRLRAKDGSIRHALIDTNVLWENGQFVHTRCFTRDITERKQAESRLHESEERLRLALEAGHMGTWEWHIPTGKVIWSPTLEAIHGLPAGSFPGTFEAYQEDIHPDDRRHVLETIRLSVEEGREHHLEYRIVWRDGSVHWVEARGRLFRDEAGVPVRLVGVCSDITQRKRMEQSLRFLAEASKSLAMLIDYKSTLQKVAHLAVPAFADWCAVDMLDAERSLQRVAVAHVDPEKVQMAQEIHHRHPPDPEGSQGIAKVLRTGEPELVPLIDDAWLETRAKNREHLASLRALNLTSYICVPLKAKDQVLGVITFVSAESGRQYAPEDLAMAQDLAHRAAIAVENARLYQEVRDADRRKDEFLAMLAHELRNPLAPIRSGLDILAMDGDGSDHRETIHLMQEQVEHVVRLVDDLLDVSRIMRGKIELRKEPTELSALVHRSVNAVRPLIESHTQQLVVSQSEQPIWLNVDPVRIVQVVENLLNNASKYTDAGGRIEISTRIEYGEAVIRVSDTGIGIEPELLPNVFELFTQSTRSLDRAQGGLGIGLTLVQRLVGMHEGSVSAHSEGPGKGSTFTVRLPIAKAATEVPRNPEKTLMSQNRRILVVDDNVGAARVLAKLLTQIGDHEVETAHDGPSAFAKVKASHPDIVLLDIGLPGMDGYQVGKCIRELPEFDDVLLVALTGYGQAEDREKSKQVGFDEHLVKPPSVDQMKKVLSHPKLAQH